MVPIGAPGHACGMQQFHETFLENSTLFSLTLLLQEQVEPGHCASLLHALPALEPAQQTYKTASACAAPPHTAALSGFRKSSEIIHSGWPLTDPAQ